MTNMETLFIGYPPCSTCKKAYKALLDLGIEATYRNIKEENPTKEEIQSWIDRDVELKKLFNTSGMLYRELNIKEKRETDCDSRQYDYHRKQSFRIREITKIDLSMTGLSFII